MAQKTLNNAPLVIAAPLIKKGRYDAHKGTRPGGEISIPDAIPFTFNGLDVGLV